MSKHYNDYVINHLEAISTPGYFKGGLGYSLRNGLSAVPAAIGHTVDTLFGLDGLFGDRDGHFAGPVGFLLGLPFWLVGAALGQVLQMGFSLPSYVAYYLIDYPISFFVKDFEKAMKGGWLTEKNVQPNDFISMFFARLFSVIGAGFRTLTYIPHKEMNGLFGFIVGVVPEFVRYGIHRLITTFISCTQFITDGICSGVRSFYSAIARCFCGDKDTAPVQANEAPAENKMEEESKVKISLPGNNVQLKTALDQGQNLFRTLGITYEQYMEDPTIASKEFRKLAKKYHSDHNANTSDEWNNLSTANAILSNSKSMSAKKYLSAYKRNPTLFGGSNVISIPSTTVQSEDSQSRNDSISTNSNYVQPKIKIVKK